MVVQKISAGAGLLYLVSRIVFAFGYYTGGKPLLQQCAYSTAVSELRVQRSELRVQRSVIVFVCISQFLSACWKKSV